MDYNLDFKILDANEVLEWNRENSVVKIGALLLDEVTPDTIDYLSWVRSHGLDFLIVGVSSKAEKNLKLIASLMFVDFVYKYDKVEDYLESISPDVLFSWHDEPTFIYKDHDFEVKHYEQ